MQKWEYTVFYDWLSDAELNKLGDEGWELVAVGTISAPIGSRDEIKLFFKRPKS